MLQKLRLLCLFLPAVPAPAAPRTVLLVTQFIPAAALSSGAPGKYNHQKDDQQNDCDDNGHNQQYLKEIVIIVNLVVCKGQFIVHFLCHGTADGRVLKVTLYGPLIVLHIITVEALLSGLIHTVHDTVLVLCLRAPYPALNLVAVDINGALLESFRNLHLRIRRKNGDDALGYPHPYLGRSIGIRSAGAALCLGHHNDVFLDGLAILGCHAACHAVFAHLESFVSADHLGGVPVRAIRADNNLIHIRSNGHRVGVHIR